MVIDNKEPKNKKIQKKYKNPKNVENVPVPACNVAAYKPRNIFFVVFQPKTMVGELRSFSIKKLIYTYKARTMIGGGWARETWMDGRDS